MPENPNIYFASDFHLGAPNRESSLAREKRIIRWLDEIKKDASEIYLVGDLFDFWFEYKTVVPRGYSRFLGKLAEICDLGIPVNVFIGNHDMWQFGYLEEEIGVKLFRDPITKTYNGKKFFIGHGDGLGPGDHGYKFLKKVFSNPICQWLFARLHPNFGIWLANYWSGTSRDANGDEVFQGKEEEWLYQFATEQLKKEHIDYFIFGHRHLKLDLEVSEKSRYVNLGDWIGFNSYAVFDGEDLDLKVFEG